MISILPRHWEVERAGSSCTFVVTSLTEFRNTASEVRLVLPLGPACLGLSSAAAAASSRACDTTGARFVNIVRPKGDCQAPDLTDTLPKH